jgi:amino acid adenylation domain-containing protein
VSEPLRRLAALPAEKRALLALRNPLSFAQQRLWFVDQLQPGDPTYNVPAALALAGPLDVAALALSLSAVAARHAVLRTVFPAVDGRPLQLELPPAPVPLPLVDLGALPAERREGAALAAARLEAATPFDLAAEPLLRAVLVRLDDAEHLFLLDLHHIVCDGWSQEILVRETAELYAAAVAGRPPALAALPIQYADYARWQRGWLAGDAAAAQLAYWRRRLAGAPPALELPADRPRGTPRRRGGTAERPLPPALGDALEWLGRAAGASPFMAGLAAFQALLGRWTGQSDVVVGTPMAGRPRLETEGLVGLFLNMLALRTDLSDAPSFRALLARVRQTTLADYDHQELPFERLVDELQPERVPGQSPLFQAAFTLVARPPARLTSGGLAIAPVAVATATAKYDLSLSLAAWEGSLTAAAQWDAALFDRTTIERLLGHYAALLAAAAADPERSVAALPLLSPAERHQLLAEWNDTAAAHDAGPVQRWIVAQARRTPDAIAVFSAAGSVSYGELVDRAARLAGRLRRLGAGPDGRVGLALERSADAVVAVLAILLAGAAWVPIEPDLPRERRAFLLADAAPPVVVTPDLLAGLAAEEPLAGPAAVAGDALAYVLYTSGSTGRPKGAMNTHAAVANRLLWQQRECRLEASDRVLHKTPYGFDVSVWELLWPLFVGARIIVALPGGHLDMAYLADLVASQEVTTLHFVPPLLRLFLEQEGLRERCAGVRRVLVGGEALTPDLERRFHARLPGARLHHLYGPTEAAIDVTARRPTRGRRGGLPGGATGSAGRRAHEGATQGQTDTPLVRQAATVPIGRPIANLRVHLLDAALAPVPIGVAGELAIGGAGLARGYWGRPELTAERFVPDPFAASAGGRLYRTGDRARHLANGEIEFLGRLDQQVKIRGVRIEPGEVEAALERHPAIARALVDARSDPVGEKRLVAWLVPRPGSEPPAAAALRRFLEPALPAAMIPAAFVALPALPLLPSGKVDRRALPAPASAGAGEPAAPRTPSAEAVAAVWEEVLGRAPAGVHDDFFALGGHSILATQVIARLRAAFRVELPLLALFEAPTVAGLALRLDAALRAAAGVALPPLARRARQGPAPLSFAQQRLWFLDRLEPGNPFYNLSAAVRLAGALDAGLLARVLAEVVRRHEALRTRFVTVDGEPAQVIAPAGRAALLVADLTALPPAAAAEAARAAAAAWVRRPFDLAREALLRAAVLRLSGRDHAVILTLHHIASDGWSMGVLAREVSALYTAFARGEPSPLPELPLQYADFALWQREWLEGEPLAALVDWWRQRLGGDPPPLELPADRPRPPVESHRGALLPVALPAALVAALAALGRRRGATLFGVLMAGFQALLHRTTGRRDPAVGFPVANRTRVEVEPLIGFFVNTLVLRADLPPGIRFAEHLDRVHEAALGAYAHQDLPFEKLVEALAPQRSLAHAPLFQVMLALQNAPPPALALPGVAASPFPLAHGASRFDWALFLGDAGGDLAGSFEYAVDRFDAPTVARAFGHLRALLAGAVAAPERPVAELPLLAAAERHQLLVEWAGEPAPAPPSLVERCERQARRAPAATAVRDGGVHLSYGELNRRANRLAHRLRASGAGPEARLALHLDRSAALIVAILAVAKAGGACLPLDPAHPPGRRRQLLADADPLLVLAGPREAGDPLFAGRPVVTVVDDEQDCIQASRVGAELDSARVEASSTPTPERDDAGLLYVLYTSGSTGSPKGVAMGRGALANLVAWQIERSSSGARTLQFAPATFDVSFQEIFSTLGAGGELVLAPEEARRDPAALLRLLIEIEIERAFLPVVALEGLAAAAGPFPAALREVVVAGERLRITPAIAAFFRRLPGCRLDDQYGPTEGHVVTAGLLTGPPDRWPALPPIGRPVAGVRIHLLDPAGQPVPAGVAGELLLGGAAPARGYLGRPDWTAERFVPDPFAASPGARLYRTGDLARRRADGVLEFLGRIDDQLKIRGFRVEPGEVEVALCRHPAVRQAAVVARDARLVAYVVATSPPPADLRAFLARDLPEPLLPATYVFLPSLPLTASGKVDRRRLPEPGRTRRDRDHVPPATALEGLVAAVWEEVLEVHPVGRHDDFFALGGHSLLATRAVSRLAAACNIDLPLRRLFEHPTVAALAATIELATAASVTPLAPSPRSGRLPLSFAQQRLWLLDRLDPGSAAYHLPLALSLHGPLDLAALSLSLAEIVRRHESLRTTFPSFDNEPVQAIAPPSHRGSPRLARRDRSGAPRRAWPDRPEAEAPSPEPHRLPPVGIPEGRDPEVPESEDGETPEATPPLVPLVDLAGLPAHSSSVSEAQRLARDESSRPFDLARGPLFRPLLLRLAPAEHHLLATLHHIVADGWSLGVLVRELAALYAAAAAGDPSPLPELPVQPADVAVWQRAHLSGERLTAELRHWRQRLAGAPPALELPADRPRPAVARHRGGRRDLELPAAATAALRALCRRESATLFMGLLAAFAALLGRHAGQPEAVIGSPIANRTRSEMEGLIGFFVNTLALRVDLSGEPGLGALTGRAREVALDAYAHQELPFERLVEELAPPRDLGRSPVFQAMLALQNAPAAALELPGLRLAPLPAARETAKFDLTLSLAESAGGLGAALSYDRDLFDATTIDRLLGHFGALLVAGAAAPDLPMADLPLLAAAERHQLLHEWSGSPARPRAALAALFAAQAARRPDAVALSWDGGELTYRELDAQAERIAVLLRQRGAGAEARVGLCLERSPDLIAALLGVVRGGAAYVPLDPGYPDERLRWLAADAGVAVVVAAGRRVEGWPVVMSPAQPSPPSPLPPPLPPRRERGATALPGLGPDRLACVLYTSGSTGEPKGVAVTEGGIVRLVHEPGFADLGPEQVFLQLAPLSFDAATLEIWGALGNGGRLVLPPPGPLSLAELGGTIARFGVTTLWLTAGLFHRMVDERPEDLRPLAQLLAGGDVLSPDSVARLLTALPGLTLWNGYGPTENATFTCVERLAGPPPAGAAVPIGRPLAGTGVRVLDAALRPLPAGVAGELCATGGGLARGYLGRPAETAERFVPDPFAAAPGARLYRTGDRARWLADGRLDFLGRLDRQVKVRGFRVEPAEVEAALARLPGVRQAAAAVRGEGAERRLVAWAAGEGLAAAVLRAALRERLPEFLVPSEIEVLAELPLAATGKVDRAALARRGPAGEEAAAGAAPRTLVEELLAAIWGEVLGRERVGVDDGFFDLGGHSLLATQVVSRVRQALGVELPLRDLFEAPTVAGLAARLERARGAVPAAPPLVPFPRDGTDRHPLSFAQQRLWFLDGWEPGSAAYNVPLDLHLRGRLLPGALARALLAIVHRHESLRTTLEVEGGSPVQVVHPPAAWPLPGIDLAGLPAPAREREAARLARAEARRPFDLARGPLVRVALLRLAATEHLLLATLHHAVADGWSLGVLVRELGAFYRRAAGEPAPLSALQPPLSVLPPLPVQYGDYARWQRGWLAGEVLAAEVEHWRRRLAGAPAALELPTDRPRPAVVESRGGSRPAVLPAALASDLRALARSRESTPFMALAAGFAALLGRYAGQEEVCLGTPVAGRTRVETEGLIGLFVNTLVLRLDLAGGPSFAGLLARAREVALDAHAHQEVPFEKLVEALAPGRSLDRAPLFQAMLTLQNAPREALALPGLALEPVPVATGAAKFDLTLSLAEGDGGFAGSLEYAADLYDAATIDRLLGHLRTLLAAAAADPGRAIAVLPLLPEAERHQLLVEWNDAGPAAGGRCLHDLFFAEARRSPARPALVFGEARIAYRALAARAGAVARRLRRQGVGPEVTVGVLLERTPDLVAALLGVLAAGAAYVPLDPHSPPERLATVLAESRPALVVTSAALFPQLPAAVPRLVLDPAEELDVEEAEFPPVAVDRENLAYVIFTSGSTGRPKGVAVAHRGAAALAAWARQEFSPADLGGVLAATSIAFDLSVFELLVSLALGGTVVLAEDALALAGLPAAGAVTLLDTVPAAAEELLRLGALPASLRVVNLAGEPLRGALAARLVAAAPRARLLNLYGPTEDTTYSTFSREDGAGEPAIGRPLPGTRAHVLGPDLAPLPVGAAGELCLGGAGLARGYLRRPERTAAAFVPDPFAGEPGERLYRTGDRVRRLPDGRLDFRGRLDRQVKVRGFRVEPGEVEAALARLPGVRQAAVAAEGEGAGRRLVAWVAGEGLAPGGLRAALRAALRGRLPEHLVPAAITLLPELPLTATGKVDLAALERLRPAVAPAAAGRAPCTLVEEVVAAVWCELLGRERVGADDDFFELGGHSLLATQAVARLRQALAVELPLRDLFEAPTVAALAARIERGRGAAAVSQVPPLVAFPRDGSGRHPLSFAQQRLWFLDRWEPGSAAYHLPVALRLAGSLLPGALAAALGEIVRRHESLRTTFAVAAGAPVQVVHPFAPPPLPLLDLGALPEPARGREAARLVRAATRRPFDLERGPLLRALLVRLAPAEHLAVATLHHAVADGWSLEVLVRELAALYRAGVGGEPSPLPPLPVQYADYARWQRGWLAGDVLAAEIAHWRRRLAGAPAALALATDRPRPAALGWRGGSRPLLLPAVLARGVRSRGRAQGATPFMVLVAAFAAVLGRHAAQPEVCLGTPVAGRTQMASEGLIGLFVNTLVLRVDLGGEPSFAGLLARVRAAALDAHSHQELPFEKLVEALAPDRRLDRTPLFQAMLAFQNAPRETVALPGLALAPVPVATGAAKFELTLALAESRDEAISGALDYAADLYEATTIERLLGHLRTLLEAALADPGRPLADLPLLTAAERHQLIFEWNDCDAARAAERLRLETCTARLSERAAPEEGKLLVPHFVSTM